MVNKITSRENTKIKEVIKLLKDKKYRDDCKKIVTEGLRLCKELLLSDVQVSEVFYTEKFNNKHGDYLKKFIDVAVDGSYCVSEELLCHMSDTDTPQGIICVCKYTEKFDSFDKIKDSVNVIGLENIQNPSNLGTILRTCDAMGVDAIIITGETCDIYNPKVIRGSMGSVFHLPIVYIKNSEEAISVLSDNKFSTYAMVLDENAEKIVNLPREQEKRVLFIGNEGNGLLPETINQCSSKTTIHMKGKSESLNAAVAASIAIWEMTGRGM